MSRNFLFSRLRTLANQSLKTEVDLERRKLLQGIAIGATGLALAPLMSCSTHKKPASKPKTKIAIIGAGLAGTHCAYQLSKAGIRADLYEASSRIGGRTFSLTNHFADGQTAELGGELIDSNHKTVFRIASELGLQVDDCRQNTKDSDHFIVDGEILSTAWILENFKPLAQNILTQRNLADKNPDYFQQLDLLTISEWLDLQHGIDPKIKKLLANAYTGEFGLEVGEQSAISLLYFIDPESTEEFKIFGDSDERFHIRNGNDQMAKGMASKLASEPFFEHRLLALKQQGSSYQLSFQHDSKIIDRLYDLVVIAIPFTLLRQVDLSQAGFSPEKLLHIQELGYGTNAKIMAGFTARPWYQHTDNFSLIADDPVQTIWETSRGQPGTSGIITNFLGGNRGLNSNQGTALEQFEVSLQKLEINFPGISSNFIPDKTVRMHWPSYPLTLGSYACYRPGQAGKAGLEAKTENNIFFCGEHCSVDFQGFMEGALETGEKTASQILAKLK